MDLPCPPQALFPGVTIGSWTINDRLSVSKTIIAYRARDAHSHAVVIEEYFPSELAERQDGQVMPRRADHAHLFESGRRTFIETARQLQSGAGLPSSRILDVIEAHGTAYAITPGEPGLALAEALQEGLYRDERQIIALLRSLAGRLSAAHQAGIIHGAISPANILLSEREPPMLVGFGAPIGGNGVAFRATPYAAVEQYVPVHPAGPWTDIYALGAVLYHCATGAPPPSIPDRSGSALALELESGFRAEFRAALAAALKIAPQSRPRSIDEWLALLPNADAPTVDLIQTGQDAREFPIMLTPGQTLRPVPILVLAGVLASGLAGSTVLRARYDQPPRPAPRLGAVAPIIKPQPAVIETAPLDAALSDSGTVLRRVRAASARVVEAGPVPAALKGLAARVERAVTRQKALRAQLATATPGNDRAMLAEFRQIGTALAQAAAAASRIETTTYAEAAHHRALAVTSQVREIGKRAMRGDAPALQHLHAEARRVERQLAPALATLDAAVRTASAASLGERHSLRALALFRHIDALGRRVETLAREAKRAAANPRPATRPAEVNIWRPPMPTAPVALLTDIKPGAGSSLPELVARADDQLKRAYKTYMALRFRAERSYTARQADEVRIETIYEKTRTVHRSLLRLRKVRNRLANADNDAEAARRYEGFKAERAAVEDDIAALRSVL